MVKVLALTVRPALAADVRYRILQYGPYFRDAGIRVDHRRLFPEKMYLRHEQGGGTAGKIGMYLQASLRRLWDILSLAPRYDAVWVGRELSPLGPPFMERLLGRYGKPVILDMDDAIFLHDETTTSFVHHHLRDFRKYEKTARVYRTIVCGNAFLADYFRSFHRHVEIIPTVVSSVQYGTIVPSPAAEVRIGWIGTPENRSHLELIREPLIRLAETRRFSLTVVGLSRPLDPPLPEVRYVPWRLEEELSYFREMDIGVMPLRETEFAKGKCAFKIVQYLASGLPVVASPVGANREILREGETGFFAATADAWTDRLGRLIDDAPLRRRMGREGRETVRRSYCVEATWRKYAALFFQATAGSARLIAGEATDLPPGGWRRERRGGS